MIKPRRLPQCEKGTSIEDLAVVSSIASPAEGVLEDVSPPDMTAEAFALRRVGGEARAPNPGQAARAQGTTRGSSRVRRGPQLRKGLWFRA